MNTKYDCGDEVYFIRGRAISRAKIERIIISSNIFVEYMIWGEKFDELEVSCTLDLFLQGLKKRYEEGLENE